MTRDPVCGMEVDERWTRLQTTYRDETYFFCSDQCKGRFDENPERYLQNLHQAVGENRKVVVVGTGLVGSSFAFALMTSGLASEIVLIDRHRELAEGHVMDLNHGLSFVPPTRIYAGEYSDCRDAQIVVVTAGAPQKPGETRLDLAHKNSAIFKEIIPQIVRYDPRILLVVSNPLDVLTYAALKLSGFSMNRVLGSGTVLDTARFRFLLSDHCGVDPRNVHAYIIGEHGDSEVPVWSRANIGGIPYQDYCPVCGRGCSTDERETIFRQVKTAAYEIINRKGATHFAVSLALVRIVGSVLRDENSVMTVSTLIDDYYGINDVCLSVPVIVSRNGVSKRLNMGMDDSEITKLRQSAGILKEMIAELGL